MTVEDTPGTRVTTDRDTIREWAETYDIDPVRTTKTESTTDNPTHYGLRRETRRTETMETLPWDEFFDHVERNDLVIVFHGEQTERPMEVISREDAIEHAPMESTEFEERLLEGETITSEVTDTTVVERTIVDQATIESEIVDTELLDSNVLDVELRSRKITEHDVVDQDLLDSIDHHRFDDMDQLTEGHHETLPHSVGVAVTVDETWTVTRELLEQMTIESRIVDSTVTETDEVESERFEETFEIKGFQQSLLESDMLDFDDDPEEVIQSDRMTSEFQEDDVVRTQFNTVRTVEEEISEKKVIRGELTDSESIQVNTMTSTPIKTVFVDSDTLETGTTEPVTTTREETESGIRTAITDDDEGKPVVGSEGQALGMVEEVRGDTAYINPEPGIVDRIKSKLGWGDADEDDYAIDEQHIEQITDDEVQLEVPKSK